MSNYRFDRFLEKPVSKMTAAERQYAEMEVRKELERVSAKIRRNPELLHALGRMYQHEGEKEMLRRSSEVNTSRSSLFDTDDLD